MVVYGREIASEDLFCDMLPLIAEESMALMGKRREDIIEDISSYLLAEENGNLIIVTARENGEIVGHTMVVISGSVQFKNDKKAYTHFFHIRKDKKKSRVAYVLMKKMEEILISLKVDTLEQSATIKNNFQSFLERVGYEKVEIVLRKKLY